MGQDVDLAVEGAFRRYSASKARNRPHRLISRI